MSTRQVWKESGIFACRPGTPANKGGRHILPARDHPHMPMTRVSDPASTLNDPIPPTVQPDGSRPPRVVIDTAVIVSALVFGGSQSTRLRRAWRHGYCRPRP